MLMESAGAREPCRHPESCRRTDDANFAAAKQAWYRNSRQIARFLSNANPRFLPFAATNRLMKSHLNQTLDEAAHRLGGDLRLRRRAASSHGHHWFARTRRS